MIKNNRCIDCNTLIWNKTIRCRECYFKFRKLNKITRNYCCIICGNLISLPTAFYGKGMCVICCKSGEKHPRTGVVLTNKTKLKISKSLKGKMSGNKSHLYKDGRCFKIYYCSNCNIKISVKTALYGKGRCKSCASSGKNNSNYNIGQSNFPYSLLFNKKLKQEIRERDNFNCQCCGKLEKQELEDMNRVLSVHHIDYNKQNCKENNLITTCQSCNSKANFNRDYWFAYYIYIIEEY